MTYDAPDLDATYPFSECPICGDAIPSCDVERHMAAVHPKAVKPPGYQDLHPELPETVIVNGQRCPVERVPLNDLADWRRAHGVSLLGVRWMGALGWVSVYGRDGQLQEAQE